eukprot:936_1
MLYFFTLLLSAWAWRPNLGNFSMPITINAPDKNAVQKLFDAGLIEEFDFNQDDAALQATNAIHAAGADSDPTKCPMCWWLLSYAMGPFLNMPSLGNATKFSLANQAAQKAAMGSSSVSAKERALIAAMQKRYTNFNNQTEGWLAFAAAMAEAHKLLPDDADISTLYVEAVMDTHISHGYNFYNKDGSPIPDIRAGTDLLERVLATGAGVDHPFARHLYIHITEPSASGFGPESAGRAYNIANKLSAQFKGTQAQHLQHMPGHTFLRTGRYHESIQANIVATTSDATFLRNGVIPYAPGHNMAFLIYAASMSGESATAISYTKNLRDIYTAAPDRPDGPGPDTAWHIWRTTRLRFSKWADVLADSDSLLRDWPYQVVLGHYAKGLAYLHHNNSVHEAAAQLAALQSALPTVPQDYQIYAKVANLTLSAALVRAQGMPKTALVLVEAAATEQRSWPYDEPPAWHMPMLQCVGQVQLEMKMYTEAYSSFSKDLSDFPENIYSLWGLKQAMEAMPSRFTPGEVAEVSARLEKASKWTDFKIVSACSTFCTTPACLP